MGRHVGNLQRLANGKGVKVMKYESCFTFGDNDQYEVIDAACVACHGEFMYIGKTDASSLPICLVCEKAMEACERDFDANEEE
tara:strand:- start:886 stop:1134 length:249 start_codon:yes stop_codon:yes gene_type:complete